MCDRVVTANDWGKACGCCLGGQGTMLGGSFGVRDSDS